MIPDQIAPIANYSPIEFGRWLYTGFDTLLDRSKRFKAFEPIDRLIGFSRDQTIVDDLADVFDLLDSDGKRSFKKGLRDALSRTLVEMPVPSAAVVDSLLLLAQRVRSTDVLPEIEKLITSEDCLHRFEQEQQPVIFARAFETVRAYRPYHEVARIILEKFAHHSLFRPGYSLRALVACLVSDKSCWPDAFETFRRKMAGTKIQLSFEQKLELKEKISKNDVQDAIKMGVFRLLGNNDLGFASDDWFVNLMGCQGLENSREQVPPVHSGYPVTFRCFNGRNLHTLKVRFKIEDYSRYDDTILICGEHGVGKGVVANTIHKIIDRNRGYKADFKFLDSRDIQPEFIKNELLGCHSLFEDIPGGILFLHSIGYISYTNQKALLKWLGRWDDNRKKLNMDIRIIASTHINLEGDLENFISDNKLRIKLIKVPSLRERISDLERLMHNLRQNITSRTGVTINPPQTVVNCLRQYNWPLNLWELQSVMEEIAKKYTNHKIVNLNVDMLPSNLRAHMKITPALELMENLGAGAIDYLESEMINENQDVLEQVQGSQGDFISFLGIRPDSQLLEVNELLKSGQYNEALTKLDDLQGKSLNSSIAEVLLRSYANAGLGNEDEFNRLVGKLENITDSIVGIKNRIKLIYFDSSVDQETKKEYKEKVQMELLPIIVN